MQKSQPGMNFSCDELEFLKMAAGFFEDPSRFMGGMNWLVKPIEYAQVKLPYSVRRRIKDISHSAIHEALKVSIQTLSESVTDNTFSEATKNANRSSFIHNSMATVVGGL